MLAQEVGGKLVTNDYNLNKVAELRGVTVLNINELSNAVKPVVIPGESMRVTVVKDGKEHTYYIYNNCDHEQAFKETGTQAVSFTTGVPAALGASMWAKGLWRGAGVFNVEEFDPDPFMEQLNKQGLPWHEVIDGNLEV